MARRPRNQPSTQNAEVTDKRITRDDTHNRRLKMEIDIDGVTVKTIARGVQPDDDRQAILDATADRVLANRNYRVGRVGSDGTKDGAVDWPSLPDSTDKQRIAQQAMRDMVVFARNGKQAQSRGRTRPQAFDWYAQCRQLVEIWDNTPTVNNVEKAAYLALDGPGDGTEFGELNKFINDLKNAAPDWNKVVQFMADCNNPIPIETPLPL